MSYLIHTVLGAAFAVIGFRLALAAVRWAEGS